MQRSDMDGPDPAGAPDPEAGATTNSGQDDAPADVSAVPDAPLQAVGTAEKLAAAGSVISAARRLQALIKTKKADSHESPNGASGGGSAGDGGKAPLLLQRSVDKDFRQVLSTGLSVCRRNLVTVGLFSFAFNLMMLAIPIYLFNVSDRVLTSRSTDTLVMLTAIVAAIILGNVLLDMSRRFILMRVAVEAESRLGAQSLAQRQRRRRVDQAANFKRSPIFSSFGASLPVRCSSPCSTRRLLPFTSSLFFLSTPTSDLSSRRPASSCSRLRSSINA